MSHFLMKLAVTLLPPNRKEWGEAMMGEFQNLELNQKQFSIGCLAASLRENVTTSAGLVRFGFFLLQVVALAVLALWIWGLQMLTSDPKVFEERRGVQIAMFFTLGFIPAIIWFSSFKAAQVAADRFYVADHGTKMFANLALAIALFFATTFAGTHLNCYLTPRCSGVGAIVTISGVFSLLFCLLGVLSKNGAKSMRNVGALGTLLLFGMCTLFFFGMPESITHLYLFSLVVLVLPVFLMTIAGAVFMWMQRPVGE